MDGCKQQPWMRGGLDLGDKYSYLGLIDTDSGMKPPAWSVGHSNKAWGCSSVSIDTRGGVSFETPPLGQRPRYPPPRTLVFVGTLTSLQRMLAPLTP
jgi:hypothetical protein